MEATKRQDSGRWFEFAALALVVVGTFALRFHFRDVALINDEGEYVHLGQQILKGAIPYADVYNQKTPFVFYFMAGVQWLAGESVAVIRIATSLYGAATTCLVYVVARHLGGAKAAVGAALAFSVMTFDQCGVLHPSSTEFFMLFWIATALWFLVGWTTLPDWLRLVLSGAAAGMAYQTKQTGLVLVVFLIALSVWRWVLSFRDEPDGWKRVITQSSWVAVGWTCVIGVVTGYFALAGALDAYLDCTWNNNWQYVGGRWQGAGHVWALAKQVVLGIARFDLGLWVIGTAGLVGAALRRENDATTRGLWILLLGFGFAAFSTGTAYVHYWEPLIVPLSLGCGIVWAWAGQQVLSTNVRAGVRLIALACLVGPLVAPATHIAETLDQEIATLLIDSIGMPQFETSEEIAAYVRERTEPNECFMIVGSEPQIFFFADRPSCTRMVLTFPITGAYSYSGALREEFLSDLRTKKPKYVLFTRLGSSLAEKPTEALAALLRGVRATLRRDYKVEIELPRSDASNPQAPSRYFTVFRRRDRPLVNQGSATRDGGGDPGATLGAAF